MTVLVALTAVCVTVRTPFVAGSAALVVLAIETVAASSLVIVLVEISVAPSVARPDVTLVSVTTTVSAGSTMASFSTEVGIVAVVAPARIVTVPDSAV